MKLAEELLKYPYTLALFRAFLVSTLKIDAVKFLQTAPNTSVIPQLVVFLETQYDVDIIDALCFTNANVEGKLNFNELLKKTLKVVFHMIEHKRELNFIPF